MSALRRPGFVLALHGMPTALLLAWSCGRTRAPDAGAFDAAADWDGDSHAACPEICGDAAARAWALQDEAMHCDPDASTQCQTLGPYQMYPYGEPGCCRVIVTDPNGAAVQEFADANGHVYGVPFSIDCPPAPCGCKGECNLLCPNNGDPFACPTASWCRYDGRCQQWWMPPSDGGADG
jgi:hypothetical protein